MATHEQPATGSAPGGHPARRIDVEPCAARVRVSFGGEVVADSARTLLLREESYPPVHYFPRDDVRMDLLVRTEHTTRCPYKGVASYRTVEAGGRAAENAVWSYEHPIPGMTGIAGYLAFYRDRMDGWSEEGILGGEVERPVPQDLERAVTGGKPRLRQARPLTKRKPVTR